MSDELKAGCDAVLAKAIDDGVPGVVAMATDRAAPSTRVGRASACSARMRP